jgi:hypothetical protein
MHKVFVWITQLVWVLCAWGHPVFAQTRGYSVLDYGAVNDGKTLTTKALQKAIDDCAAKGGGTVNFPAGTYLSGTLVLRSSIILNLEAGAELLGSGNLADYPPIAAHFVSYSSTFMERSLIFAEDLQHIGITGQGKINGQGYLFPVGPEKGRPVLIRMVGCQGITMRDITLEKPAMWTQHYLDCKEVLIDHITVTAWNANANNDGIDIDCCDDVVISNSFIRSNDDAICLKSDAPKPCRNIAISNCILSSASNGIKCGTDSYGGFENLVVSNCVITNTMLSGIALESVDGGDINNVLISNVVMKDVNNPIFIRLGDRGRIYTEGGPQKRPGTIRHVTIDHLSATGIGHFRIDSADKYLSDRHFRVPSNSIGCPISGIPGHDIEDLRLTNITLAFKGGWTKDDSGISPPEKEKYYPEYFMFGNLPAYALFIRHVEGLTITGLDISCDSPDARAAVYLRDVKGSAFSNVTVRTGSLFLIDSCRQVVLRDCTGGAGGALIVKDPTIQPSDVIVK